MLKTKWLITLIAVSAVLATGFYFLRSITEPVKEANLLAKPRSNSDKKIDALPDGLQRYLQLKKIDVADWEWDGQSLLSHYEISPYDQDPTLIELVDSISIVASGDNTSSHPTRRAYVVQYATEEPGAVYRENDSYKCDMLVLTAHLNRWDLESFNTFEESSYEGGSRYAKSCSNFVLSWESGFPVLKREQTYAGYAGGAYVETKQSVRRLGNIYKLSIDEQIEKNLYADSYENNNN